MTKSHSHVCRLSLLLAAFQIMKTRNDGTEIERTAGESRYSRLVICGEGGKRGDGIAEDEHGHRAAEVRERCDHFSWNAFGLQQVVHEAPARVVGYSHVIM